MPLATPSAQDGFSLVELTVATAIYSMGLGSLSLMLLLAVQGTSEARLDTTAAAQAGSLAESILMTSDAAGHYALPPAAGAISCDHPRTCSVGEMATWQLDTWRRQLAAELPAGRGVVCQDATPADMHNTKALGVLLYDKYILLFQLAGLILLVAMVGAIVLTLRHRTDIKRQNVLAQMYRDPAKALELKDVKPGQGL